jgi:hypothetical protein
MKAMFFIAIVLYSFSLTAQAPQTFTVKPGMNILEVMPIEAVYLYPKFTSGTVVFKDQRSVTGKLNFNFLVNAIQFIDPKGDTLSLADEQTIKLVCIGTDAFYYRGNCIRQIVSNNAAKLAEKEYYREFAQKPGSYGMSSGTTSANNLDVIVADRGYKLNTEQEVVLTKARDYFVGNKNGSFLLVNKKNLLKLFPKQVNNISQYINRENIDLANKEDLYKLIAYIGTL